MLITTQCKIIGTVTIEAKDLAGNIVAVRHGENMILNTGYEILFGLLTGKTNLSEYPHNVIKYAQFGINGTAPNALDKPVAFDCKDDRQNPPVTTHDILDGRLNCYCPVLSLTSNIENNKSLVFQATLPPGEGNINNLADGYDSMDPRTHYVSYSEVVLMARPNVTIDNQVVPIYKWFSRRTFAPLDKRSTLMFLLTWKFTFA